MKRKNIIFFIFIFILSIYYVGTNLTKSNDTISLVTSNIEDSPNKNRELITKVFKTVINSENNPINIINKYKQRDSIITQKINQNPIVYIYNTHQKEEYKITNYNISPTVFTASYMLQDELKLLGIGSLVEENDVMKELNKRKLPYEGTYDITRGYLKKAQSNKNLKYFFDVHRDSLNKNLSTVNINGKKYAKLMFLVGKKNSNYKKNVSYIEKMTSYINQNYKGVMRDTYYKNYYYNQDLNERAFLIEVGGQNNTLEEVYNSIKVLAQAIYNLEDGSI